MKQSMIIGIVLIVLGIAGLIFPVVTYTTREPVDFLGFHSTVDKQNTVLIPGIVGALALAGGIAVVAVSAKKSA